MIGLSAMYDFLMASPVQGGARAAIRNLWSALVEPVQEGKENAWVHVPAGGLGNIRSMLPSDAVVTATTLLHSKTAATRDAHT